MSLLRVAICFFVFLFLTVSIGYAKTNPELVSPSITVNLPSRTIELYSGANLMKEYPVAIGKPSTPTPLGNYTIVYKEVNPAWYPPDEVGKVVPSGPANPLGYRWLGIWNNYGIHGTNAPWSIGSAVSNGCIRMYEQDVEELFDMVNYGTPVQVTYDRVKVRTNVKGQVLLAVYPDIYSVDSLTVPEVRTKLAAYSINGFVSDELLRKLLNEPSDRLVVVASKFKVGVNDRSLNEPGIIVRDILYVPVQQVAERLKQKVLWDDNSKTVRYGDKTVPGIVSGKLIYVSTASVETLFGGEQHWKAEDNTWNFDKLVVYLNDKPLRLEVSKIDNILAVSALPLAEAMGQNTIWNGEDHTLTVIDNNQKIIVPVTMLGNQPYIQITKINEYFKAYVYWNEQERTIELTFP